MLDYVLLGAMLMLSGSISIALFRIIKGPSLHDRIMALDSISYSIIGIVAILSIQLRSTAYLETILLLGILAFLSTVALCKFMERGTVIDHEHRD